MKATIPLDLRPGTDGPDVERLDYTRPDGSGYAATVCRTSMVQWVVTVTGPDGWPIWKPAMPFRDRSALIRRCTEEIDREARRRAAV